MVLAEAATEEMKKIFKITIWKCFFLQLYIALPYATCAHGCLSGQWIIPSQTLNQDSFSLLIWNQAPEIQLEVEYFFTVGFVHSSQVNIFTFLYLSLQLYSFFKTNFQDFINVEGLCPQICRRSQTSWFNVRIFLNCKLSDFIEFFKIYEGDSPHSVSMSFNKCFISKFCLMQFYLNAQCLFMLFMTDSIYCVQLSGRVYLGVMLDHFKTQRMLFRYSTKMKK